MSNRIVFSLYKENRETGVTTPVYSTILTTELSASSVVNHLNVDDGFSAYIVEGIVLSFVDFSCINISPDYVISKLKSLSSSTEPPSINLPDKCIISFASENNEEVLIRNRKELVYTYDRFECGASGFCETVTQIVAEHPIAMIFIGGWIWDRTKDLLDFSRKLFAQKVDTTIESSPILFSPKKFHKNLSRLMNIDPFYFQIISITPAKHGQHFITVRTLKNNEYIVVAKTNGKIISINEK